MYRLQLIGHSKIAGRVGLSQTALTRCIAVPCSCLLLPPLIMAGLKRSTRIQKSPRLRLGIELAVIYLSLQAALPAALAVFPQVSPLPSLFNFSKSPHLFYHLLVHAPSSSQRYSIPVHRLEPQFRHLTLADGSPATALYGNKGL